MTHNIEPATNVIDMTADDMPKNNWRQWLIGHPLHTADAHNQTIGKAIGLAVFASDALSSTAYATQEIMIILAIASAGALQYVFPISIAITVLMAIVAISYEQTIHAYPGGGGAYIVARDNLGELPAQAAGAALLTDYILTVAVSISSGVAQIVSAFPMFYQYRVPIAIVLVFFVMTINLRGVKESGVLFSIPTYFFLITMVLAIGVGFVKFFSGTLGTVVNPPEMEIVGVVSVVTPFLLLHAFSSGTAALTGIEAISNGITAFKEPRSKNAGITLIWMASILGTLFLSISFLSSKIGAVPSEIETVISQLARTIFGGQGVMYLALIAGTTIILIMAANTAFADFPRLGALQANDGYLPRQLTFKGSRLVYSRGIITLAIMASLLILIFQANVTKIIPLYAIGVFLSFTLSQAGMAKRWWKSGRLKVDEELVETGSTIQFDKAWKYKMIINGFGAICTFIVMIIFAVTKFKDGAWIVVVIIPLLITTFLAIHQHYKKLAAKLSLEQYTNTIRVNKHRILVLIAGVHRGSLAALAYARSLGPDVTAIHVSTDPVESDKLREKWAMFGEGTRLVILNSPYRLLLEPVMDYIQKLLTFRMPNEILTVVVPQFVTSHWWENLLHSQTAMLLRYGLIFKSGIVIIEVPYQV
jgi:amino acid transporter